MSILDQSQIEAMIREALRTERMKLAQAISNAAIEAENNPFENAMDNLASKLEGDWDE